MEVSISKGTPKEGLTDFPSIGQLAINPTPFTYGTPGMTNMTSSTGGLQGRNSVCAKGLAA